MGNRQEVQLKTSVGALLDDMIGRSFIYNGQNVKVLRWSPMGDRVNLVTDQWDMKIDFSDVKERAKEFLPVEDETMVPIVAGQNLPAAVVQPRVDSATIEKLRDILLENIDNVKKSRDYIPQAQEIKAQVDSIIDLAKSEIDMMKTVHIISGRR